MRAGIRLQPGKRVRCFEGFLGRGIARRADVQGMAAVVFTEPRCRVDLEDFGHAQPAREFPFEDAQLVSVAAEAGDRIQGHPIPRGM